MQLKPELSLKLTAFSTHHPKSEITSKEQRYNNYTFCFQRLAANVFFVLRIAHKISPATEVIILDKSLFSHQSNRNNE